MTEPREVLVYTPGEHEFFPGDYPWLRHVRLTIQGGRGGAGADGTPGQPGKFGTWEIDPATLPPIVEVIVGAAGRGAPGAKDGDPGLVILELFDAPKGSAAQ